MSKTELIRKLATVKSVKVNFVIFCIKGDVRKLPQSFFLVVPPNNNCAIFVGRFNNYVFAVFLLFSTDYSSEERLENLGLRLNLSLFVSWQHFFTKKI